MSKPCNSGFTRREGVTVFGGALLAMVSALIGLWGQWILFGLFAVGVLVFAVLYSTRLCRHCDKSCPFHTSGRFWGLR